MSSDEDKTEPLSKLGKNEENDDDDFDSHKSKMIIVDLKDGDDEKGQYRDIPFKSYSEASKFSISGDTIFLREGNYGEIDLLPSRKILSEKAYVSQIKVDTSKWSSHDYAYISGLNIESKDKTLLDNLQTSNIKFDSCSFLLNFENSDEKEINGIKGSSLILSKCNIKLNVLSKNQKVNLFSLIGDSLVINCDIRIESDGSDNHICLDSNNFSRIDHNKIFVSIRGKSNRIELCPSRFKYNFINIVKSGEFENKGENKNKLLISSENDYNIYHFYPDRIGYKYWGDEISSKLNNCFSVVRDTILKPEDTYVLIEDGGKVITLTMPKSEICKENIIISTFGFGKNIHYLKTKEDDCFLIDDNEKNEMNVEVGSIFILKPQKGRWLLIENLTFSA